MELDVLLDNNDNSSKYISCMANKRSYVQVQLNHHVSLWVTLKT